MDEVCYTGSHGTSVLTSETIKNSGFNLGPGRAGTGVYFWAEGIQYIELAKEWFTYRKKNNFIREPDPICAVIIAELKVQSTEYLNCEDTHFQTKIYELSVRLNINPKNNRQISNLYDRYLTELEESLGCTIKMLTIKAAPPPESNYPVQLIGVPLCCVARSVDIIKITDIKILR